MNCAAAGQPWRPARAVIQDAGGFTAGQAFTRLYMIPGQYHCLSGGSPAVDAQQVPSELLNSLMKWVEQGTAPRTFSFPLAQPTATLSAITVQPLNPLSPRPAGARGLNTRYRWVSQFRPGNELWCATQGMDLACSRHQPTVSYTTGANTKADPAPAPDSLARPSNPSMPTTSRCGQNRFATAE